MCWGLEPWLICGPTTLHLPTLLRNTWPPNSSLPGSPPLLTQPWGPECGDGRVWVYALSCRGTPGCLWGSLSSYKCPCVQGLWQHMANKATSADLEKDYGVKGKLFPAFGTKSPTFPFWTGSSNFMYLALTHDHSCVYLVSGPQKYSLVSHPGITNLLSAVGPESEIVQALWVM